MPKAGSCLFAIGYFLYTRTRFGRYYHGKDIAKGKEKYNEDGHTVIEPTMFDKLEITPIPVALDNYAYIVMDTESNTCVVIDVGDEEAIMRFLDKMNVIPAAVLTTHKHWDHSAGNAGMRNRYPGLKVYGGYGDNVPDVTHTLMDIEEVKFGGLNFTAIHTPGHTVGHVSYLLDGQALGAPDCLFSGDHLFLGGCGRIFETPPLRMLKSLDAISRLKKDTLVWPGHEYAVNNLEFACHIEPDNAEAQARYEWAKAKRERRLTTCPSTIGEELTYNPFLRTDKDTVMKKLTICDVSEDTTVLVPPDDELRAQVLAELREQKDSFKYIQ
ncbi:probable hydrolase PNKD [Ruditapes philippinarum]|uniref:probable hydrolase PNKD n=1 Tax=Ruditapes philippinarum TaxID=129788 RepID=UPI00295BD1EB|nr:probable hydrolase PNKD [Ruditapes philippinarum]